MSRAELFVGYLDVLLPQSREGIGGRGRTVAGVVGGDKIEVVGRASYEIGKR